MSTIASQQTFQPACVIFTFRATQNGDLSPGAAFTVAISNTMSWCRHQQKACSANLTLHLEPLSHLQNKAQILTLITSLHNLPPLDHLVVRSLECSTCTMKLGFALARLSSKKFCDVQTAERIMETQEPAYNMLNDQTWTAVFSCLSTADLARSRVRFRTMLCCHMLT